MYLSEANKHSQLQKRNEWDVYTMLAYYNEEGNILLELPVLWTSSPF